KRNLSSDVCSSNLIQPYLDFIALTEIGSGRFVDISSNRIGLVVKQDPAVVFRNDTVDNPLYKNFFLDVALPRSVHVTRIKRQAERKFAINIWCLHHLLSDVSGKKLSNRFDINRFSLLFRQNIPSDKRV